MLAPQLLRLPCLGLVCLESRLHPSLARKKRTRRSRRKSLFRLQAISRRDTADVTSLPLSHHPEPFTITLCGQEMSREDASGSCSTTAKCRTRTRSLIMRSLFGSSRDAVAKAGVDNLERVPNKDKDGAHKRASRYGRERCSQASIWPG